MVSETNLFHEQERPLKLADPTENPTDDPDGDSYGDPNADDSDDDSDVFVKGSRDGANDQPSEAIAKTETRNVFRLRLVVAFVLVCSAIIVALFTYYYITETEEMQFEHQFTDDSGKVFQAIGISLDKTLGLLDHLAVTLVSHARDSNDSWPFVTLPNFALRLVKLLPITNTMVITVMPLVKPEDRTEWETYSAKESGWINESLKLEESWDGYYGPVEYGEQNAIIHGDIDNVPINATAFHLPSWQAFPVLPFGSFNWDYMSTSYADPLRNECLAVQKVIITKPYMIPDPDDPVEVQETTLWAEFNRNFLHPDENPLEPMGDFMYPIIDVVDHLMSASDYDYNVSEQKAVGVIAATFYWREMIRNILPKGSDGIHIVFKNPCTLSFTYQINGHTVQYLGVGDHHDTSYDDLCVHRRVDDLSMLLVQNSTSYSGLGLNHEYCPITLHVYPSDTMKARFTTSNSTIFTTAVLVVFLFTSLVFCLYDLTVEHRQRSVMNTAVRSTAIVSALFPSTVRDQIYPQQDDVAKSKVKHESLENAKGKLQSFLNSHAKVDTTSSAKSGPRTSSSARSGPIAELYPDTTVLFADIAGFTAWSSERQPTQVFHLLETIFGAFDEVATKRGIFKVETIGDCYVAVVGLPSPRKNHAVAMARFAEDCRVKVNTLTQDLDKVLGPGTADLAMRFGLNSGPTTAGVLRGEKTRFQLFGDTVNTAARMESNGEKNRIHVSQKTADLIKLAGKGHWLTLRPEKVQCKGKGLMTTYWCYPHAGGASSEGSSSGNDLTQERFDSVVDATKDKLERLVDWNVEMFEGLLKEVVSHRQLKRSDSSKAPVEIEGSAVVQSAGLPLDELTDVLPLQSLLQNINDASGMRPFRSSLVAADVDENFDHMPVELSLSVRMQLRNLIWSIANKYHSNPFHNFAHCCHVAMSTRKLLDRVTENGSSTSVIFLDPLTRFAIVFAALIHDVDHPGVSNAQLVIEGDSLAVAYNGKSVAEQNSVDVAWDLLMDPQFAELRNCIYTTPVELQTFRKIVVNAVMATDLFDKDLLALRATRWEKSFGTDTTDSELNASGSSEDTVSRSRATIIIDLIIQASDVSHTMQHFTVYQKWNLSLLTEMYGAYCNGRMDSNPLENWYESELWFFDNYVIPLAKKLRECGVFGVSCDEFLDYATDNRMEWEMKGRDIVRIFAESVALPENPVHSTVSTVKI